MAIETNTTSHAEQTAEKYHISSRGALNMICKDMWGPRTTQMANPWTPDNPKGTVILRLAENSLMHPEIVEFAKSRLEVESVGHLTYSTGPRGSMRLRKAAASFLTKDFKARTPVTVDDITITLGLTAAIDAAAWSICNEGEGILIPRPRYNGFTPDIENRSGAVIVGVTYQDIEGYSGFDDLFLPEMNVKALETALLRSKQQGIKVRALLISNPHNPLGRCYPAKTLEAMIAFCGRNELHFISDEIYALSVFSNARLADAPSFTSVLSLELEPLIDPNLLHVLYGASKDFCANGLRLGLLYSRNAGIKGAISSNSQFSWSPHLLQDIWAAMLEDEKWRNNFISENHRRMASNYDVLTESLRSKDLPYYETNAAVFVWVDLRHFMLSKSERDLADYSFLRVNSPDSTIYAQRESKIVDICMSSGVLLPPGSAYKSEEFGWFRITFTLRREALEEGLRRLWAVLEQIVESNWE